MFKDFWLSLPVAFLLVLGVLVLTSIAPNLFPLYYVYVVIALLVFWFLSQLPYELMSAFSKYFYIGSILMLLLTLVIGSVTRGTIRWIPIGPLSLQPAEIVRPFIIVFFAKYLTGGELTMPKFFKAIALLALPVFLILIQPSLGVSVLTVVGFIGVLIAMRFNKKYLIVGALIAVILVPVAWQVMAPYQKQRVETFFNKGSDPLGSGYNSLQSTIATGAGRLFGRGLGRGIQTQLAFLPEKQTDFIFAAIGEELGFVGGALVLIASFMILYRLIGYMEKTKSPEARAYISGFTLVFLVQIFIHVGMNMGMLPITGLPFPLLSAGGSSLLATMIGLGIAVGAREK